MKRLAFVLALAALASGAAELKDLKLKAKTDKENPIGYKVGETIRFDFFVDGLKELPEGVAEPLHVIWERTGDDGAKVVGTNGISLAKGFSMETKMDCPGIVRVEAQLVGADFKVFESVKRSQWDKGIQFSGGAGVETEKMKLTTVEPADFDTFWREAKAKLATVPVRELSRVENTNPKLAKDFVTYGVAVDCFGPRPVTGWLTVPRNAKPGSLKAIATFDGYNGNGFGLPKPDSWTAWGAIMFHVNAHGYDMTGRDEQYYKDYGDKVNGVAPGAPKRATYALEPSDYDNPRETYFYYMAMRVMRAFDYLKTLPEWNGRDLEAQGGSQGGLQTMWAAGLVEGLTAARPSITWGCDIGNSRFPAGSKLLSNGWGIPHVPGAFYFDSALHAKRVPATCAVDITRLGMGDYTCPPRGVLLSYYLMKCPVKALLVQGSTHGYVPPKPNQTFTISK